MGSTVVAFLELLEANALHIWLLNLAILSCGTYLYWVYRKTFDSTSHRRLSAENARGSGTGVPLMMMLRSNGSPSPASSTSSMASPEAAFAGDAQEAAQTRLGNSTSIARLTGEDVSRIFSQQGYKKSLLGTVFYRLSVSVPILSQVHLALIGIQRHVSHALAGGTFTFLFVLAFSHLILAAMCALPTSFRIFFMLPCPLREADFVLINEDDEENSIPEERTSLSGILAFIRGDERNQKISLVPVVRKDAHYFEYTGVRFLWSSNADRFRPVGTVFASGAGAWRVFQGGGAATSVVSDLRRTIGPNIANVDVPSLSSSLLSEFGDFLYVFQLACFWLFYVYAEWNLALVWLMFIGSLGLYRSLFFLRMAHLQVASTARELASKKETVLRSGKWVTVEAYDLVLGDLVQITESCISADLALVSGCVGVNESALTGDAAPLQKIAVDRNGTWELDVQTHGKKHMLFCGTQVIRCIGDDSIEGSNFAIGLVVGIGGRTMHAQIVRMLCLPSQMKFKYHNDLPKVFLVMSLFAFSCLMFAVNTSKDTMISTTVLGLQGLALLLHPLMPAALNFGQVVSARRLSRQHIGSLCLGRVPVAGKLSTLILDKTGTITHDGLFLVSVRPVSSDGCLGRAIPAQRLKTDLHEHLLQLAMLGLASRVHDNSTLPDETSTGAGLDKQIAQALGVSHNAGSSDLTPLRWLEFDVERNTSGVVVRCASLKKVMLFLKGSPDRILQLCPSDAGADGLRESIDTHARDDGFYVLAVAWKEITDSEIPNIDNISRDDLEKQLHIGGLLLFRNELKPDSCFAIAELILGGVCCAMCTGDSVMTGVNVARRCGLFSAGAFVLIGEEMHGEVRWRGLDGSICSNPGVQFHSSTELALTRDAFHLILEQGSVAEMEAILPQVKVFGRMRPDDKIQVVRLWQKFRGRGLITGMVGDGANDCGAIRAAHVGIALGHSCAAAAAAFNSVQGLKKGGFISLFTVVDIVREGRACLDSNLAMYMLFATYSGILAIGSVTMRMWLGSERFMFSEWQLLALDAFIGIVVVCSIACGRPPKYLAPERPTWNLLGPRSVLTVALVVSAHFLVTLIIVADLLYGSGREFVEIVKLEFLEVPRGAKGAQGDNHVAAILFIQTLVTLPTVAIVFSRANDFRDELCKNLRLVIFSGCILLLAGILLWAPPNALGCLLRVGCDNPTSRTLASRFHLLQSFSTWGIGGCFYSPNLVSCRANSSLEFAGLCWVAPPRNAHLPLSWVDGPEDRRPAPFWTVEDKRRFCSINPYKVNHSNHRSLGNTWCFYPNLELNNCEPNPPREQKRDAVTGCIGPNNCFSGLFKARATAVFVLYVAGLGGVYPALSSLGRRMMPPSFAQTTFRQFEAARDIEMAEIPLAKKANAGI